MFYQDDGAKNWVDERRQWPTTYQKFQRLLYNTIHLY